MLGDIFSSFVYGKRRAFARQTRDYPRRHNIHELGVSKSRICFFPNHNRLCASGSPPVGSDAQRLAVHYPGEPYFFRGTSRFQNAPSGTGLSRSHSQEYALGVDP